MDRKDYEVPEDVVKQIADDMNAGFEVDAPQLDEGQKLTVPQQHQKNIAVKTLKLSDVGANVMGGMSKDEARKFLKDIAGWSSDKIKKLEFGKLKESVEELDEAAVVTQIVTMVEKYGIPAMLSGILVFLWELSQKWKTGDKEMKAEIAREQKIIRNALKEIKKKGEKLKED